MHPESAIASLSASRRAAKAYLDACVFCTIVFVYNLFLSVIILSYFSHAAKECVEPAILFVAAASSLWPAFLVRQRELLW